MMALFRYVYDMSYDDLIDDDWVLQFDAKVYVVAEKYHVTGLHEKTTYNMKERLWNVTNWNLLLAEENDATDFFAAVKIIFTESPAEDNKLREALVEFSVSHINNLKQVPAFSALLGEHGDLATEMFAHDRLSFMLEGTWFCNGDEDRRAVPRCPECEIEFSISDLRAYRSQRLWRCSPCGHKGLPVCCRHDGMPQKVEWKWL